MKVQAIFATTGTRIELIPEGEYEQALLGAVFSPGLEGIVTSTWEGHQSYGRAKLVRVDMRPITAKEAAS